MDMGWSKGHRKDWQASQRRELVESDLVSLGFSSLEQYHEYARCENFLLILGVALQNGITWFAAEIAFYDQRREERDEALRAQYQDMWNGDGTGVYDHNKEANFADDITLYWYLHQQSDAGTDSG